MSKFCEDCKHKERLLCRESNILQEDIELIFKTKFLKEFKLKCSIKTKKGVDELYNILLSIKREGNYDALSFCGYPCLFCQECTLNHHMKVGYTVVSNRRIYRCMGLLGLEPINDEYKAWILLNKEDKK